VWPLVSVFLDIALHRRGPEALPASQFLLGLLLALYLIANLLSLSILGILDPSEATLLLTDSIFVLAYVFMVLRFFRHERRFRQTASALLGTDVLFNVVGLPLALWSRAIAVPPDPTSTPTLLRLLIVLWWIDVAGFIFGRATARPYIVGVLFVILYIMVSLSIRDLLAPITS